MNSITKLTFSILLFVNVSVNAATAGIFCKTREYNEVRIFNALTENGHFECQGPLSEGIACFTGKRAEVISAMNSRTIDWPLQWSDEWINNAHYRGLDSVSYNYNDGPNGLTNKTSIDRCPKNFFKVPEVGPILD